MKKKGNEMQKQRKRQMKQLALILAVINLLLLIHGDEESAVGDPGMKRDGLRVAFEAWNFCNEVGIEAPHMGSPRAADCFDQSNNTTSKFLFRSRPLFSLFLNYNFRQVVIPWYTRYQTRIIS